ncbi:MAG: hypothetical protein NTU53_23600 [Planctomycetota bacterium]|nr:hypothetical protein [Planctomycetota bacterium]
MRNHEHHNVHSINELREKIIAELEEFLNANLNGHAAETGWPRVSVTAEVRRQMLSQLFGDLLSHQATNAENAHAC